MLKPSRDRLWTYDDYCDWPDDERWELIDGVAYDMVPAPTRLHQEIVGDLYYLLRRKLEGQACHLYAAPFDVRLPDIDQENDQTHTVVQPDISVFCSEEHLDDKGARGAPDLVVEILSPSTSSKDSIIKRALYERHGVPEYWIVDPEIRMLYQFTLESGCYPEPKVLDIDSQLESVILAGVTFDLKDLFRR